MVAKLLAAQALSLTHARSFVAGLYTMILGFISLAIDRFRKLDVTDIALFKWIMLGFGFFLLVADASGKDALVFGIVPEVPAAAVGFAQGRGREYEHELLLEGAGAVEFLE